MITKIKSGVLDPRYGCLYPSQYVSENKITNRQVRQLTEYIMSNWNSSEDDKQSQLSELEDMSEVEAAEMLYQTWRVR